MTEVESSNLKSVYYNSFFNTLEVEFVSGSKYQYFKVPYHVYRDLLAAESKGKYFAANIKNKYTTVQVAPGIKAIKRNINSALTTIKRTFLPESFMPSSSPTPRKKSTTVKKIKSVRSVKSSKPPKN